MKKILNDKKERILKLEKGSFEIFSKALQGHLGTDAKPKLEHEEENTKPKILFNLSPQKSSKKKRSKQRTTKSKKFIRESDSETGDETADCDFPGEVDYLEDHELYSEIEEDVKPNRIELELFECCRICLRNDLKLFGLYKKHKYESHTNAELVEYCLGIHVSFAQLKFG
jgi:hypothetical protein